MKSYTDIEQSKKLAKILPIESADMNYHELPSIGLFVRAFPYKHDNGATEGIFPCWSLAALLNVLPKSIVYINKKYFINIAEGSIKNWIITYDSCVNDNEYALPTECENLVDACYEMILKLHELNLM